MNWVIKKVVIPLIIMAGSVCNINKKENEMTITSVIIIILKYLAFGIGAFFMIIGLLFITQEFSKWLRGEYK
jgi:ABC-type multidrug transport system permease subunit